MPASLPGRSSLCCQPSISGTRGRSRVHEGKTGLRYPGHAGLGRLRPASGAWAGLISLRVDPRCGEIRDKPDYPGKENWRCRARWSENGAKTLLSGSPWTSLGRHALWTARRWRFRPWTVTSSCARRAAHAQARQDAEAGAEEIIAESRAHPLGGISIRELLDDGRRG